jgi:anti-sigma regulatory factor (Ser/Thr protein kinase)
MSERSVLRPAIRAFPARGAIARLHCEPASAEYALRNCSSAGQVCHELLRTDIDIWILSNGATRARSRQVWAATWEAIQNAVKHGSSPGEIIRVKVSITSNRSFVVQVRQPRAWPGWGETILRAADGAIDSEHPVLGGIAIIAHLTERFEVFDGDKSVNLYFSF